MSLYPNYRKASYILWIGLLLWSGCVPLPAAQPVVKIGLVAPFEGRYRALGYEALYAAKWAVRQRNAAGGVAGYMVELVALNDNDAPDESAFQAHKLALDPELVGVVGPFSSETLAAAAAQYAQLELPLVAPALCADPPPEGVFCLSAHPAAIAQTIAGQIPQHAAVALFQAAPGPPSPYLLPLARQACTPPWDHVACLASDLALYEGDVLNAATLLQTRRSNSPITSLWGGPSLARLQLPQIAGAAVEGVCYVMTAPLWADTSPDSEFVNGYRQLAGQSPGPWAALTLDAVNLLLDALQRNIQSQGRPSRSGLIAELNQARTPDGELVFIERQRNAAETQVYCYAAGESYPGHLQKP